MHINLQHEKNKLNSEFPQYEEITSALFERVYELFSIDFENLSDNGVYRCFLDCFKEIICFAFENEVSKKYLRHFFKLMNNEIIVGCLTDHAKDRAKDIKNVMNRFVHFFTMTWQGYGNNKDRVLEEIICMIDCWM